MANIVENITPPHLLFNTQKLLIKYTAGVETKQYVCFAASVICVCPIDVCVNCGQPCQAPRTPLRAGLGHDSRPAVSAWSMNTVTWAAGGTEGYRDIPAPHGPSELYRGHWCTLQTCQSLQLRLITPKTMKCISKLWGFLSMKIFFPHEFQIKILILNNMRICMRYLFVQMKWLFYCIYFISK